MNALLQHRGCSLLTAGRSIAVQGFNENGGMLALLALYALATAAQWTLSTMIWCFCILVTLIMSLLVLQRRRVGPETESLNTL
jgi:hypothetical protein